MALLKATGIGQEYGGKHILREIDLEVERGETIALIGPTGAGKTTLLRLLDLLDFPASGSIYFDGADVTRSRGARLEARRRMSLVQQKPIVFSMNVQDNIACGLRWRRERRDIIRQKVERELEMVGLSEYGNRNAKTLSGGETQRVAIARALVTEPELLLLDEPTANLDPPSVAKIEDILTRIISEKETTVLMATHDMSQGQRLADRIGVLAGGKMLQVGSPNEVFCSPKSMRVAEFVGIENILPGVITERDGELVMVEVGGRAFQALSSYSIGDSVHALVRPEDVTIMRVRETSSARNVFKGG